MPVDQRKLRNHKARLPDALHPFLGLLIDRARNAQGSPHKPLLALMMLMRLKYEGTEKLPYREIKPVLEIMLRQLNIRTTNEALVANPFWRLQNEGVWKVTDAEGSSIDELAVTTLNGPEKKTACRQQIAQTQSFGIFQHAGTEMPQPGTRANRPACRGHHGPFPGSSQPHPSAPDHRLLCHR